MISYQGQSTPTLAQTIKNPRMRLVVDTNVLLSLYVYHDPRHIRLRQGWQGGEYTLLLRQDCFDEICDVITRPNFKLDKPAIAVALAEIKAEASWLNHADVPTVLPRLPKCRDRDDQKFLELAALGRADVLLTYDKAVLACRKRTPFTICKPEDFFARETNDTLGAACSGFSPLPKGGSAVTNADIDAIREQEGI
jgi:uncharacterized protein